MLGYWRGAGAAWGALARSCGFIFQSHPGWLIPRPGAIALLVLEREVASPEGPDPKLCPARVSPSGP